MLLPRPGIWASWATGENCWGFYARLGVLWPSVGTLVTFICGSWPSSALDRVLWPPMMGSCYFQDGGLIQFSTYHPLCPASTTHLPPLSTHPPSCFFVHLHIHTSSSPSTHPFHTSPSHPLVHHCTTHSPILSSIYSHIRPPLHPPPHPTLCPPPHPSVPSIRPPTHTRPSIHPSVHPPLYPPLYPPSIHPPSTHLFFLPSTHPSTHPSIHPSTHPSVHPSSILHTSIHPPIHPPIRPSSCCLS